MLRAHTRKDNPVIRNLFKFERKHKNLQLKEGSLFNLIAVDQEKEYIVDQTVISVKENGLYFVRLENDVWVNNTTHRLKRVSDGTLIGTKVIVESKGIIMKSVFSLKKRMYNTKLQTYLN